jgi:hypothetical protein
MTSLITFTLQSLIFFIIASGTTGLAHAQETLYWVSGGDNNFGYTDNSLTDTSNILCGNGSATVTFTNPDGIAESPFPDAIAEVLPNRPGGTVAINQDADQAGQRTTMTLSFTVPVNNLRFSMFDIDRFTWTDITTVAAFNGATGTNVTLACSDGDGACSFAVTNNNTPTATATGNADNDNAARYAANGRVDVTVAGPVTRVTVTYVAGLGIFNLLTLQFMDFSGFSFDCTTVPVTVSSFRAQPAGNGVQFDWTTATETANVGFYLYGEVNGTWQRLHSQLIPSPRIDSLVPARYSQYLAGVKATQFVLAEVDIRGTEQFHGPYQLAQAYGRPIAVEPIDWQGARLEQLAAALRSVQDKPVQAIQTTAPAVYELGVAVTGLYRVTYEDLVRAGLDLNGVPTSSLALTNQGKKIPLRVESGRTAGILGPGGFVEFFGEAVDTLYTTTNIYRLELDPAKALRIREARQSPAGTPPAFYAEKLVIEENREYSFAAPNGDPWYDAPILAFTSPAAKSFNLHVDKLVNPDGARLHLGLWGVTDWPGLIADHHVVVSLNGVRVADRTFDGLGDASMNIPLPKGVVKEGNNSLIVTLPGDTGMDFDLIHVDSYGVAYRRAFVAKHDRLTFKGTAGKFQVGQLSSPHVVVYGLAGRTPIRFTRVTAVPDGSGAFRAVFAGQPAQEMTYFVSTVAALHRPTLTPARPGTDLLTGSANYLVITHPSFLDGLDRLVTARRAQGFTVKVVNVEDVYARYSGGVFDPAAIRRYLRDARQRLGVTHVLLVGGDTYDYHDYLGVGSTSFIPTLYTPTDDTVRFAPSDALLADVDGDQVPDFSIGRFPVRTRQELATMVAKTLAYNSRGKQAIFAADVEDGVTSFSQLSDEMQATLPIAWLPQIRTAYIDQLGLSGARAVLLSIMNQGVALTNYIGHSSPTTWSFDNLLTAQDAAKLTNKVPTVSFQWGCWNGYHSVPQYNTLSHALLLQGPQGAAAVVGASTVTVIASDQAIGRRILRNVMRPGQTLGGAIHAAKRDLVASSGNSKDVVLGLTLLGDPALVIEP